MAPAGTRRSFVVCTRPLRHFLSEMTTKPQPQEKQPKSDERNIVSVDSSYEGASFEDKIFLLWNDYKRLIVGALAVIVLVFAGWGIAAWLQGQREQQITAAYQTALSIDERKAFAEEYAPHPLAGAALLEVADYHFSNGEYNDAVRYYQSAADLLPDVIAGRAKIGIGASFALNGETQAALEHFESVARDVTNFSAVRAEAHYHAATLAAELGQFDTARDHIARISELDHSQLWASRARSLEQSFPQPKEEPAEADSAETEEPAAP